MRTLIIGDIHNRIEQADAAIEQVPHDRIVFVGDYFDSFGDGRGKARRTAEWLVESIHKENRTYLFGNHDVPYFKRTAFSCPGWSPDKDDVVNYIMSEHDWRKMKFYTWVDDWLISHAGVHPMYIPTTIADHSGKHTVWNPPSLDDVKKYMSEQNDGAWKSVCDPICHHHWFWDRGPGRGGDDPVGGLLWCDWRYEFTGTTFNQIVGHTPDSETPIRKQEAYMSVNYCVDGLWGGVLVLEDGKPEIWTKQLTSDGSFVKVEA